MTQKNQKQKKDYAQSFRSMMNKLLIFCAIPILLIWSTAVVLSIVYFEDLYIPGNQVGDWAAVIWLWFLWLAALAATALHNTREEKAEYQKKVRSL